MPITDQSPSRPWSAGVTVPSPRANALRVVTRTARWDRFGQARGVTFGSHLTYSRQRQGQVQTCGLPHQQHHLRATRDEIIPKANAPAFPFHMDRLIREPPHRLSGREPTRQAGGPGLIPGEGSSRGEGNGNPLQCSCLENPDRGAWQATVRELTRSWTGRLEQLSLLEDALPLHTHGKA